MVLGFRPCPSWVVPRNDGPRETSAVSVSVSPMLTACDHGTQGFATDSSSAHGQANVSLCISNVDHSDSFAKDNPIWKGFGAVSAGKPQATIPLSLC